MWSDNETDRDFLNFRCIADTAAEMIIRANGQPLSVGVSGGWGVGKSSMLKKVLNTCESVGGRIMSLHSREATSLILDLLEAHRWAGAPVMHWFSGTKAELRRAINLGCWFSVGPAMLRTSKGRSLVSSMPADRILTETDGPFARCGKTPLMPWVANKVLLALARLWNVTESEVQRQLLNNLRSLVL